MWKVLLAFLSHRFLLVLTAFIVLNLHSTSPQKIENVKKLSVDFLERISQTPEFLELNRVSATPFGPVFTATSNPFLWMGRGLMGYVSVPTALLILSNLFFFLFLFELFTLTSRMVTQDVAIQTSLLAILWPTSFELSLGSTLSLEVYLVALVLRTAVDNVWFIAGLALAGLALLDPLAVGLVPCLLFYFFVFQRHLSFSQVVKRLCFFLIPLILVLVWKRFDFSQEVFYPLQASALFNIRAALNESTQTLNWALSRLYLGQTLTLIFFALGALLFFFSHSLLIHRFLPLLVWIAVLAFTPYREMASRALLAGLCLAGIAAASSEKVAPIVMLLLLGLGIYDVVMIF